MKRFAWILFLIPVLNPFAQARDADGAGNGGGAWVCSKGDIKWMQVLDLFEAVNEFKLELDQWESNSIEIAGAVMKRFRETHHNLEFHIRPFFEAVLATLE
ncbi:MAG: hypothetical protein AAB425_08165, partial [Bdellovibrionota bacterium]